MDTCEGLSNSDIAAMFEEGDVDIMDEDQKIVAFASPFPLQPKHTLLETTPAQVIGCLSEAEFLLVRLDQENSAFKKHGKSDEQCCFPGGSKSPFDFQLRFKDSNESAKKKPLSSSLSSLSSSLIGDEEAGANGNEGDEDEEEELMTEADDVVDDDEGDIPPTPTHLPAAEAPSVVSTSQAPPAFKRPRSDQESLDRDDLDEEMAEVSGDGKSSLVERLMELCKLPGVRTAPKALTSPSGVSVELED